MSDLHPGCSNHCPMCGKLVANANDHEASCVLHGKPHAFFPDEPELIHWFETLVKNNLHPKLYLNK